LCSDTSGARERFLTLLWAETRIQPPLSCATINSAGLSLEVILPTPCEDLRQSGCSACTSTWYHALISCSDSWIHHRLTSSSHHLATCSLCLGMMSKPKLKDQWTAKDVSVCLGIWRTIGIWFCLDFNLLCPHYSSVAYSQPKNICSVASVLLL